MNMFAMKSFRILLLIILYSNFSYAQIVTAADNEDRRIQILGDIISTNLKPNGRNTFFFMGPLPDQFFSEIRALPLAIVISNANEDDFDIDVTVPFHANVVIISCTDFNDFESSLTKAIRSPYWYPLSNVVVYYHTIPDNHQIATLFYILWYYKAAYAILIHYDDSEEILYVSQYNPYISDKYRLDNNYGCWTSRKIEIPISKFEESFTCVDHCLNVSISSKFRVNNLGTCIGFSTLSVSYDDRQTARGFNFFFDKTKNLHGYTMRAFTTDFRPFLRVEEDENGTFSLHSRDGTIWNTMSSVMNFTIDLSPSAAVIKKPFSFEQSVQQVYAFSHRKGDLFLYPLYQFDIIILEIDYTFAYKDSGVCIVSHRAEFETVLFNLKLLQSSYKLAIQFAFCFICIWFVFCLFNTVEKGRFTLEQAGRDLVNTVRSVLLISLHNPPKKGSFRIFLTTSIWCFFVMSFASQAAIIAFFTAMKRGKEVDTFEDILEKGYNIEGIASPDIVLPSDDLRFKMISDKIVPIENMFECVQVMVNDSKRFCFMDCSIGRYIEKNMLNDQGVQYLHIAQDRIHSYYLNMIFPKHSAMSDEFSRRIMYLFEAGLIKKWEEYRYAQVKGEAPVKPLKWEDVKGIYNGYCLMVAFTCITFIAEIISGNIERVKLYFNHKVDHWKRARVAKRQ